MQTRIYVVDNNDEKRLIEATSGAQAIRHAVKDRYSARVATTKDMANLMLKGVKLEHVSDEPRAEAEQLAFNLDQQDPNGSLTKGE